MGAGCPSLLTLKERRQVRLTGGQHHAAGLFDSCFNSLQALECNLIEAVESGTAYSSHCERTTSELATRSESLPVANTATTRALALPSHSCLPPPFSSPLPTQLKPAGSVRFPPPFEPPLRALPKLSLNSSPFASSPSQPFCSIKSRCSHS